MKKLGLIFLLLCGLNLCLTSCVLLMNGWATAEDFKKFPHKAIQESSQPYVLPRKIGAIHLPNSIFVKQAKVPWEQAIREAGTYAFLIVRQDTIVYENYYEGRSPESLLSSFSVAKSFVSALIGIAIEDGYIEHIDASVTQYIPELDPEEFKNLTIKHLLDMNSGIKFRENNYTGLKLGRYYYGKNIMAEIPELKLKREPGSTYEYNYKSINTQLLGIVLERATGQSLSKFMEERLWQPLGAAYGASWSIDSEEHKREKAFCCIQARARDFAKFGIMYANKGFFNGQQIVPSSWIERNTTELWEPWTKLGFAYNNGWSRNHWNSYLTVDKLGETDTTQIEEPYKIISLPWDAERRKEVDMPIDYMAKPSLISMLAVGHLGQYVYVIPHKKMVFVRLGKKDGKIDWQYVFEHIADMN